MNRLRPQPKSSATSVERGSTELPRVKPGDSVTAINSSVAVIAITPKS